MAVTARPARSALLLALCGLALLAQARALSVAPAPAPLDASGMPMSADLLLPEKDSDVVALLSHLMSAQHEVVLATHGKDSPEAALSFAATTAQEQFTNWYLQFQNNPPYLFDLAYNFVNNFSAAANATLFKISPNLAKNVAFGKLTWFQNAPKIATNTQTFAAVQATAVTVQPCLIRFGPAGVIVDPIALNISPRLIQAEATGINVSPVGISIGPLLIGVTPSGTNVGLTNIAVSPVFIDVSPTVKIVAGSGKPATFSKGISINPVPKPPTITDKNGKQVYPPPSPPASAKTSTSSASKGATTSSSAIGNPTTSGK